MGLKFYVKSLHLPGIKPALNNKPWVKVWISEPICQSTKADSLSALQPFPSMPNARRFVLVWGETPVGKSSTEPISNCRLQPSLLRFNAVDGQTIILVRGKKHQWKGLGI